MESSQALRISLGQQAQFYHQHKPFQYHWWPLRSKRESRQHRRDAHRPLPRVHQTKNQRWSKNARRKPGAANRTSR